MSLKKFLLLSSFSVISSIVRAADVDVSDKKMLRHELTQITSLTINGEKDLTHDFFHNLVSVLNSNRFITAINFNYSTIGDDHVTILLPMLQKLRQLTTLHLCQTGLGDEGVSRLCEAFMNKKPRNLVAIDLSNNAYGIRGVRNIQALAEQYPNLKIHRGMSAELVRLVCDCVPKE